MALLCSETSWASNTFGSVDHPVRSATTALAGFLLSVFGNMSALKRNPSREMRDDAPQHAAFERQPSEASPPLRRTGGREL